MDYILWYIGRRSKVLFWETTKTNLKYNKTSNNFTIQEYFILSVLSTKCYVYHVKKYFYWFLHWTYYEFLIYLTEEILMKLHFYKKNYIHSLPRRSYCKTLYLLQHENWKFLFENNTGCTQCRAVNCTNKHFILIIKFFFMMRGGVWHTLTYRSTPIQPFMCVHSDKNYKWWH